MFLQHRNSTEANARVCVRMYVWGRGLTCFGVRGNDEIMRFKLELLYLLHVPVIHGFLQDHPLVRVASWDTVGQGVKSIILSHCFLPLASYSQKCLQSPSTPSKTGTSTLHCEDIVSNDFYTCSQTEFILCNIGIN
jgi:hypothetical protein